MKNLFRLANGWCFLIMLVSCSKDSKEIILKPGEGIHHDDFQYVVTDYSVIKRIGFTEDSTGMDGNFYVVNFKVINNAVRVDHPWNNSIAYLIDEKGNTYENQQSLQEKFNNVSPFGFKKDYITSFQTTDTTVFIFELPPSVKHPYLMVRGETLMGDFFDGNQFRKTKVKLF